MKQRLSEFITLQRGFDLPASQRVLGEVPVVASTGIVAWHNLAKVKAPGVVIGRSGSIGGGQFVELFYGATKENPYRDENIGFFHICVAVDDIHEAWRKIVETGAPQDDAPKQGADFNWQCWTHDPDGIKIELMQLDEKSPQMRFIREKV